MHSLSQCDLLRISPTPRWGRVRQRGYVLWLCRSALMRTSRLDDRSAAFVCLMETRPCFRMVSGVSMSVVLRVLLDQMLMRGKKKSLWATGAGTKQSELVQGVCMSRHQINARDTETNRNWTWTKASDIAHTEGNLTTSNAILRHGSAVRNFISHRHRGIR